MSVISKSVATGGAIEPSPILTLERMRQIVNSADEIDRYIQDLGALKQRVITSSIDWNVLLEFMDHLQATFGVLQDLPVSRLAPEAPPVSDPIPLAPGVNPAAVSAPPVAAQKAPVSSELPKLQPPVRLPQRTYVVEGQALSIPQLCEKYNKPYSQVYQRINALEWTIEEALGLVERVKAPRTPQQDSSAPPDPHQGPPLPFRSARSD